MALQVLQQRAELLPDAVCPLWVANIGPAACGRRQHWGISINAVHTSVNCCVFTAEPRTCRLWLAAALGNQHWCCSRICAGTAEPRTCRLWLAAASIRHWGSVSVLWTASLQLRHHSSRWARPPSATGPPASRPARPAAGNAPITCTLASAGFSISPNLLRWRGPQRSTVTQYFPSSFGLPCGDSAAFLIESNALGCCHTLQR